MDIVQLASVFDLARTSFPNFYISVVTMQRLTNPSATRTFLALATILFAVLLVYIPNTHGVFLLDDWLNLADLDGIKRDRLSWESVLAYTVSGYGSPGRPLSLITFAIQAESWPSHPEHFKYLNVIIHAVNAMLVYLLCTNLLNR